MTFEGHPTETERTDWRFTLFNPNQIPAVDGQYQISDVTFDGSIARATLTFTHDGSEVQSHTIGYRFEAIANGMALHFRTIMSEG